MGLIDGIKHAASSVTHAVTHSVDAVVDAGSSAAHHVADATSHAANAVGHGIKAAADGAAHVAGKVKDAAVHAARSGAQFVDKHSHDIAAGLGAAALVTSFIPGVNAISPFLALGAAGLSAYNTGKDIKEGKGAFQTAFDAVGILPGVGAGAKLAKVAGRAGEILPAAGRLITAGRVGYTAGTKLEHAIAG
ncbi:MAG: hypothetical protein JWM98_2933 [Thermoleophilia bacterium]|nr:hypothetical protein [Thermoleophilia bacterium]